ncbi:protein translocase subunit [Ascosphaera pollenicola]|nr:protein translocase subunit [Ascosphaera pollenicola]
MSLFGSSSSSDPANMTSAEVKQVIINQLQSESAIANARALMTKLQENCFDKCVPTPGSSLSSGENACLTTCMEKYISLWNNVSKAYITRVTKEQQSAGMTGALTNGESVSL